MYELVSFVIRANPDGGQGGGLPVLGRRGGAQRLTCRTIISTMLSRRAAMAAGVSSLRSKIRPKVDRLDTLKKHRAEIDMCRSTGSTSGRNTPLATPRWQTSS